MSELEQNSRLSEKDGAEKYQDRRVRLKSPFFEKLDHFWFHHKAKVIVILVLAAIVFITLMQYVGRKNHSVMIAYAGPSYLSGFEIEEIENIFSTLLQERTGNEKSLVGLTEYPIYSKAQIESMRAETDEDGKPLFVNSELNSENYDALYEYIMTGDTAVLILDPWLYGELFRNDRLAPMSELFDTVPPSADEKGYGIVLGETDLYERYDVLRKLPEETVVCCLKPYVFGNTSDRDAYEAMKDTIRAIAEYSAS